MLTATRPNSVALIHEEEEDYKKENFRPWVTMPPRFPDEVDVFSVPHSRMRDLVRMYKSQLSTTDFNNSVNMSGFLSTLLATFKEFQQHEQIENRFIMDRLKRRLNALSVYNSAVCNCHQDNRLTEMLEMVRGGLDSGRHDQDEFVRQLRRKLDEFTDNFLPHMKEEEEIFQPLLMKYFGYDELRELKQDVLQNHQLSEKVDLPEKAPEPVPLPLAAPRPAAAAEPAPVPRLPPEVLTLIFCHLRPPDRAACAAVCRQWRSASLAPRLWRSLSPAAPAADCDAAQSDVIEELMLQSALQSKLLDLDADVDECDPYYGSVQRRDDSHTAAEQRRRLKSLTAHTLPLVGQYVQKLVLAGCQGLGSTQLRQLLVLCPNVRHLDVSYTPIGDCSFKRLPPAALQRLEHVDLSGCERLTDRCVDRLVDQLDLHCPPPPAAEHADIEEAGGSAPPDADCYDCESHEECSAPPPAVRCRLARDKNGRLLVPASGGCRPGAGPRLTSLLLSGCQRLTSAAVWRLAGCRAVCSLRLLDVSGCWRLTGAALRALAAAAPRLDAERLWYCDQIGDGPHPDTANGCDNVECPIRHCCRNK
ncbi:F-box/LRR-repeat protein 5-like isoform X1 [Amphibalanus amphitrite]|uniref:F-box/LRR-repeat protein 5-like isoform X1 n=2 Tax=Amphibalanus amphitrite TaxID=1232801 RepID=UPI001C92A3B7|nr:F-box/LRR-repeat protein 5-like isoform X1 [Amphibalanus amphitrite]